MKRLFDIVGALVLGIVAAPVVALAAIGVLVDLGCPILFVQTRSGRGGREFKMAKLRSMTEARASDGRLQPDGVRLTCYGRFLRRARIDELPGLWHVLRGQMSLVGPRPLLPATIRALAEGGAARGRVRPGLTGWSQVNGNALLRDDDKIALDLWYIEHASARLDLTILLRTLVVIVGGERLSAHRSRGADAGYPRRGG